MIMNRRPFGNLKEITFVILFEINYYHYFMIVEDQRLSFQLLLFYLYINYIYIKKTFEKKK